MLLVWRSVWQCLFKGAWGVRLAVRLAFLVCCLHNAQCELQALSVTGKSTSQSTTHDVLTSQKAIDGNQGTFSHTALDVSVPPWWKLDLGGEHCLGQITVLLRTDCCGANRFLGATARAGLSSDFAVNQRCGQPATLSQASNGATNVFLCDPPVLARWVSFDIDISGRGSTEAILQLAEVTIMEYTWECNPKTTTGLIETVPPTPPTPPKLRSASFAVLHKGYKMVNPGPLSSDSAQHLAQCAGYCMKHSRCFSFDFSRVHGQCHLRSTNASDVQPVADAEFSIYEMLH